MPLGEFVIGGNLQSLLFGYSNDIEVIIAQQDPPKIFERIYLNKPLLGLKGEQPAEAVWANVIMDLSLRGQIVGGLCQKHVNISETIKLKIEKLQRKELQYKKCYVFNTNDITLSVDPKTTNKEEYLVYDWIDVRSGSIHEHVKIETNDEFVSKVHFYRSDRIDGNKTKKDAVCLSVLTEAQLQDFNYSDTMARFKLEKLMKDLDIRGTASGKGFAKIKLEVNRREIKKLENSLYVDEPGLVFMLDKSSQEVIDEHYKSSK